MGVLGALRVYYSSMVSRPPTPPFTPLCPCQSKDETTPWWAHLWSLWGTSAPPPFILQSSSSSFLLGSCQSSEALVRTLLPYPASLWPLLSSRSNASRRARVQEGPKSFLSQAATTSLHSALQLIVVGFFFQSVQLLAGIKGSFLTANS